MISSSELCELRSDKKRHMKTLKVLMKYTPLSLDVANIVTLYTHDNVYIRTRDAVIDNKSCVVINLIRTRLHAMYPQGIIAIGTRSRYCLQFGNPVFEYTVYVVFICPETDIRVVDEHLYDCTGAHIKTLMHMAHDILDDGYIDHVTEWYGYPYDDPVISN